MVFTKSVSSVQVTWLTQCDLGSSFKPFLANVSRTLISSHSDSFSSDNPSGCGLTAGGSGITAAWSPCTACPADCPVGFACSKKSALKSEDDLGPSLVCLDVPGRFQRTSIPLVVSRHFFWSRSRRVPPLLLSGRGVIAPPVDRRSYFSLFSSVLDLGNIV